MKSLHTITVTILMIIAGVLSLAASQTSTEPGAAESEVKTFDVDPVHSATIFRVQHLGAGMFYGRFNDVTGTIEFDPESNRGLVFDIAVSIDSVDSGHPGLDGHLKNPDFFNAVEFPNMTFKSTSAKHAPAKEHPDGDVFDVEGDLTMHGVTKRIKVEAVLVGHSTGKRGEKIGLECIFSVKRSEYGMSYGVASGSLGDETRIIVSLEATAQ